MQEGQLLWSPSDDFSKGSNLSQYMRWLEKTRALVFEDYETLRRWSVTNIEDFWGSLWEYFDVQSSTPYLHVLDRRVMPGAKWFEGSLLNYAEHMLRFEASASDRTVIHHGTEFRPFAAMTWGELGRQVRIVATQLRSMGVVPGDRVVSYMPNIPETAVAMLATIAIGAVWSSAAPEFGVKTVIERFSQIEPKVLFASDGYRFGGKDFRRESEVRQIINALPSLQQVVWCACLGNANTTSQEISNSIAWPDLMRHPDIPRESFNYERVGCDHPLWILFSSGTTGLPKAIVHSHVGVLMEHLKMMHFHVNLGPESVMFFYTTTGWVMFNMLLGALLTGSAIVLYDGSPTHPGPELLWKIAEQTGVTSFGASPTYVQVLEKAGLRPGDHFDVSRIESIFVSGAPATPETFSWFYDCVKPDLWLTSQSGGTEVAGAFVGSVPVLPVYAGEIQCRCLGMDVRAWSDDGKDLVDEVGELVVTSPFPSMPISFWNDVDGRRYHESYFDVFKDVWRHGDFIRINARGGCYIKGRSDSTLNRYGVRIGTAEIYRAVEQVEGVADSLVVCCELPGGNFFMPLFVSLKPGVVLDAALVAAITSRLRADCSPRHVPDRMYAIDAVPYTLTAKKMEVPVRKILMGTPLEKAASRDAMKNPEAIDYFVRFAEESKDYQWRSTVA
ncbi:MAG: acetoacetate--CoA ligase [Betaproteobacteria bacterium HGW-Betaproteobacteria-5]|jgi:acetoacetyl-CoA synthetase|nr:MAG: acetoacetate--CoA ligase [Betaproteobacteria bacterium HGW-Betaproteobacteria-5]PKO41126.1 MAG: acetoacetate--CoA ligase [Betaproteobacteria bacterium HGW-Betaproteobacteria-6]